MNKFIDIISDTKDWHEKKARLAYAAEMEIPYLQISDKSHEYISKNIICDIFEGSAPYRPRYILPDYEKYLLVGSKYLNIAPPKDIFEAINSLLIIYKYVPSITGYPVYLGQLDDLLEPFCQTVDNETLINLLSMFFTNIDRTLPDAFVHANIGPYDTKVGRLILDVESKLQNAVPNLSFKVSSNTSADFLAKAIATSLKIGKPYFVNDDLLKTELGTNYGVASCYNTLKIGGGSFTLVRLNLKEIAINSENLDDFFSNRLPEAVNCICEIINARAKFIVENSNFFESSFLGREGLIDISKFTSMCGVFGLYECVQILTNGKKMGFDNIADTTAHQIIKTTHDLVKSVKGAYCDGYDGRIGFHAQSGIDTDRGVTSGVRFKCGAEPALIEQLQLQGMLHSYFDTGVSEICLFDKTARNNVPGVIKIIKGAFKNNIKILSVNSDDSDLIRVTGYLVKKTDAKDYFNGEIMREDTVKLACETIKHDNITDRTVRKSV